MTDEGDWFSDTVIQSNRNENLKRIKDATELANSSDIILLFVGGNEATSREGWAKNHLGDTPDLNLLGEQNELIKALAGTGKPIIGFVFSGPPLAFTFLDEKASALVQCWYLGQETGTAIANLITGETNPSGKLSITIPRSAGHLPDYYFYKPSARRGYLFNEVKPLYPFGFGLSYTSFQLTNIGLNKTSIDKMEDLIVKLNIKNTGNAEGGGSNPSICKR